MSVPHFVGKSNWTRLLRNKVLKVAAFSSNVLITGPSGTGKALMARSIHQHSPRQAFPFVPVDCTSLTGELFASHLFGHVKGAFTGADHPRLGCFRVADKGTILLDEIGELSVEMQSKLLRTIQERVVVPLGSDEPFPIDVRIIAATNRDLMSEVREGRFRLDLFYRLNVVSLETIALSQRREDIEPLAAHFLDKLAVQHGFPQKRLSRAAITALERYSWPGNVRELQNVMERAAIFALDEEIGADAIPGNIAVEMPEPAQVPQADDLQKEWNKDESWPSLAEIQRRHIEATLGHAFYNQSVAANLLHIDRASLARKISRYNISIPRARRGRPKKATTDRSELSR